MKKIFGGLMVVVVCIAMIVAPGCMNSKTAPPAATATTPAAASTTSSTAAATTTSTPTINWSLISQYYHTYIAGLIAPIGEAAATIADPQAGPAIALASKEVSNLDTLLAGQASNASLQTQVGVIDKAITAANAKVGAVLTAAQAPATTAGTSAVPTAN